MSQGIVPPEVAADVEVWEVVLTAAHTNRDTDRARVRRVVADLPPEARRRMHDLALDVVVLINDLYRRGA